MTKRLGELAASSQRIAIDSSSKLILMSDCHRGDSSASDDFLQNRNIAYHALSHYLSTGFTYIELGDGDELWENRSMDPIERAYGDFFSLLNEFARRRRLYMLYGNHDFVKKKRGFPYGHRRRNTEARGFAHPAASLYHQLEASEALVLDYEGREILLVHGHQVDFMNCELWRLSRFLVRYIWRPLQLAGLKNPASVPVSDKKSSLIESKLSSWADKEKKMIIAGHTHHEVFARQAAPLYFNDGCCTNPDGISGIEIEGGQIRLVHWRIRTRQDGTLFVKREVTNGPRSIAGLFASKYGL